MQTEPTRAAKTAYFLTVLAALSLAVPVASRADAAEAFFAPERTAVAPVGGGLDAISEKCKQPGTVKLCVAALLAYRCQAIHFFLPGPGDVCAAAGARAPELLDIVRYDVALDDANGNRVQYNLPLIFEKRLLELVKNPRVQEYFDALPRTARGALDSRAPFSLFDFTVKYAGGRAAAIEWLAVLFQDTSWVKLQYHYAYDKLIAPYLDGDRQPDPDVYRTLLRMSEALDLLSPQALAEGDTRAILKVYPSSARDTDSLNLAFYHFYPMAKLAQDLAKEGRGDSLAFFIPYLFNAEYEFQTLDPARWPLRVPAPVVPYTPSYGAKLRDIYAGYLGALFGVNRVSTSPFEMFARAFAENPMAQLRRLAELVPNR